VWPSRAKEKHHEQYSEYDDIVDLYDDILDMDCLPTEENRLVPFHAALAVASIHTLPPLKDRHTSL